MRSQRISVILGTLLFAAVVASADKVTSDYDRNVNFGKFKTYMWIGEAKSQDPFMNDRIMAAVDMQLKFRGLRRVGDGADLAVGANLATEEKHTWETYYSGGGWGWGDGWATTTERTYVVGTLTVDLFDAKSKKLVWQGVSVDTLSRRPNKRWKDYDKSISKMFREFPGGFYTESMLRTVPADPKQVE
jgi:hypothetical protein